MPMPCLVLPNQPSHVLFLVPGSTWYWPIVVLCAAGCALVWIRQCGCWWLLGNGFSGCRKPGTVAEWQAQAGARACAVVGVCGLFALTVQACVLHALPVDHGS